MLPTHYALVFCSYLHFYEFSLAFPYSRKWKAQDRKSAIMVRGMMAPTAPPGTYTMGMPPKATLPYGAMEDRIRWASMAEAMANQNIYTVS